MYSACSCAPETLGSSPSKPAIPLNITFWTQAVHVYMRTVGFWQIHGFWSLVGFWRIVSFWRIVGCGRIVGFWCIVGIWRIFGIGAISGSSQRWEGGRQAGANANAEDAGGHKPILAAAANGFEQVVELLLPVTTAPPDKEWTVSAVIQRAQDYLDDELAAVAPAGAADTEIVRPALPSQLGHHSRTGCLGTSARACLSKPPRGGRGE